MKHSAVQWVRAGLLCTVAALAVMSCNEKTTSIKNLLADPGKYDGHTVRVAGEVGNSIGALGYGAYELNDGTGTLPVVTEGGGAPTVLLSCTGDRTERRVPSSTKSSTLRANRRPWWNS